MNMKINEKSICAIEKCFNAMVETLEKYYKEEIGRKVLSNKKERARKCKFNGGTAPFGYSISPDGNYEIDSETGPIVLEIFIRFANGQKVSEISSAIQNRYGFGSQSNATTNKRRIYRILKDRQYIGEYHYKDIVLPDGIPAIVSDELYSKVQNRKKMTQKGRK